MRFSLSNAPAACYNALILSCADAQIENSRQQNDSRWSMMKFRYKRKDRKVLWSRRLWSEYRIYGRSRSRTSSSRIFWSMYHERRRNALHRRAKRLPKLRRFFKSLHLFWSPIRRQSVGGSSQWTADRWLLTFAPIDGFYEKMTKSLKESRFLIGFSISKNLQSFDEKVIIGLREVRPAVAAEFSTYRGNTLCRSRSMRFQSR